MDISFDGLLITERELHDVNNLYTVAVKKHSGKMVSISQENGLVLPISFKRVGNAGLLRKLKMHVYGKQ